MYFLLSQAYCCIEAGGLPFPNPLSKRWKTTPVVASPFGPISANLNSISRGVLSLSNCGSSSPERLSPVVRALKSSFVRRSASAISSRVTCLPLKSVPKTWKTTGMT